MNPRSPVIAGLLAIALVTVTVPLLPVGSASGDNLDTCTTADFSDDPTNSKIFEEGGFVSVSHPGPNGIRASQALYFHVLEDQTALGFNLQSWSNGQDAYVIHLEHSDPEPEGCTTDGEEEYCFDHQEPDPSEGFPLLTSQPDGGVPDVRIQFYTALLDPVGEALNPEFERGERVCPDPADEPVPANAHYAVVYVNNGVPEGIQFAEQVFGPYTLDFGFELYRS